jgi:hypothetical protein
LASYYDQLPNREKSQRSGKGSDEKRESITGSVPPYRTPRNQTFTVGFSSQFFSLSFLKFLFLYAGCAIFVLSLVFMSIHNRPEYVLPAFALGLDLMILSGALATLIAVPKMSSFKRLLYRNLDLRNAKMQVFLADVVEGADDAAPNICQVRIHRHCGSHRVARMRAR